MKSVDLLAKIMQQKDPFHESYYDHPCLIVTERDVLDTEILGISWTKTCKRKWYNLFLLSYSDERVTDYYHSTHAMRMDRMRHFRRYRDIIHPLSKFRTIWDVFMLHAFIVYKILIFCFTSIIFCIMPKSTYYLAMVFEFLLFVDIYINSRTGYIDRTNRKMVLEKDYVLLHYCSHKLFFHTVSAIPLVFIMFLRYGDAIDCDICKANSFNCAISFFSIVTLFRVNELSRYWDRSSKTFMRTLVYHFIRVSVIIFMIVVQFLHYNDTICIIGMMKTSAAVQCEFFDDVFLLKYLVTLNTSELQDKPSQSLLFYAQFWRAVNYASRPSYNMAPVYRIIYPHPLLSLFSYGLLVTCIIWLIYEIFVVFTRNTYFEDQILKCKQDVRNLVRIRQLPEKIDSKIRDYFQFSATKLQLMELRSGLYKALPKILKQEIILQSNSRLLMRIPYFTDWPTEIIEKLVLSLKVYIYSENDVIAQPEVQGDGLVIVETGVLAVYSLEKTEMGHLIDGDYFGEISLVTDREVRTSTVVAVSGCKLLLLDKIHFRQIMRKHPSIFYWLQEQLLYIENNIPVSKSQILVHEKKN